MDPLNGAGTLTQGWGANPQFPWQLGYGHLGCDWAAPVGTPIVSIADGTVLFADWGERMPAALANECMFIPGSPNNGICVVMQHDGWRDVHCHMDSTHLNTGDRVRRGDVIGRLGNTGNSTGPHVHGETWDRVPASNVPKFSRYNIMDQIRLEDSLAADTRPPVVQEPLGGRPADNRQVGPAPATQRAYPFTRAEVVQELPANRWEWFTHFTYGEMVDLGGVRTNIWYKDASGYVWSGLFTEQSERGLPEIKCETILPGNFRKTGFSGGSRRAEPRPGAAYVGKVDGNTVEVFSHWTKGDPVTIGTVTSDIWYKDSLGYAWSGLFTEQKTAGLPEFVFVAGTTPPATGTYTFTKAFPMVTQVRPAARGNFEPGNFPAARDVANAYIHQFNAATPTENPTVNRETVHLSSVIATFQGSGRVASAHFGVEGTEVVQFVDLTDRAYAQGSGNADGWSVETYGAQDPVTVATAAKLIRELQRLTGGALKLRKHQEVMATACGNGIDLAKYRALVDTPQAVTPPPVITPQIPTPPPVVKETAESFLAKLRDQLNQWFTKK